MNRRLTIWEVRGTIWTAREYDAKVGVFVLADSAVEAAELARPALNETRHEGRQIKPGNLTVTSVVKNGTVWSIDTRGQEPSA